MNLSWIFGSSMEARHLLYAYLSVWLIQGGYCAWIVWQWLRTPEIPAADATLSAHEDS
jgi:hypothetical protein